MHLEEYFSVIIIIINLRKYVLEYSCTNALRKEGILNVYGKEKFCEPGT